MSTELQIIREGNEHLVVEDCIVVARTTTREQAERVRDALALARVANKRVGLFRHGASLIRRFESPTRPTATVFSFAATNLNVELRSDGDTSPFHDIPDKAACYVEIGVDLDNVEPDVKKIVEEFERHGRRPKFGPPLREDERGIRVRILR